MARANLKGCTHLYNIDAFNATKNANYQYGQFFKAVMDEYGFEKAMKLHIDAYKQYGAEAEKSFRDAYGNKIDIETLARFLDETLKAGGWEFQMIQESPESYLYKHTKCPECEGLFMAGLDADTVERHCRTCGETITPYLQKLVPKVRFGVRKWNAPDSCEEELVIIK